ncbi:protoporphyrinogen oxidase [Fluviispira sanaruensis]|uniref:Coproporphyrinogen III oxidase n=1 Tax=Fluviispira sanaruensis TaxID=2493639 RepID=A0A4P2VW40_FLUSA|nr:protoporphyrinogen oxidase [Fluviispira sanaruensis]BBH53162.1 protoporphyrinogen oxidase [Fluviispira sanaruensis]
MNDKEINIAVIGTGISGLRTAYILSKRKDGKLKSITLFDQNDSIGGVLKNTKYNGYCLEHGAQGVLLSKDSFKNCVDELDLNHKILLPGKSKLKRYLITPSEIVPITPNLFKYKKKGLLRIRDILRIFLEVFIKKPITQNPNESLYGFFSRRFGKKFASTFLVPLSFGIWGGSSRKLLVRYTFPQLIKIENGYGSLFKAGIYKLCKKIFSKNKKKDLELASFSEGLPYLIQSLYKEIKENCTKNNIQLSFNSSSKISEINKHENKIKLIYTSLINNDTSFALFESVIYTGQPWRENGILTSPQCPVASNAYQNLKKIESHSIAVVGLGGKNIENNAPQGFGALAGEWSQDILGVLFVHSIYPQHAPEKSFFYRVMLGGDRNPNINLLTNEQLLELSKQRLKEINIITDKTEFDFTEVIKWDNYIPLSTELQDKVLQSIWQLEAIIPGLFFAGNYIKGPAVPDCILQANETAEKVMHYIDKI